MEEASQCLWPCKHFPQQLLSEACWERAYWLQFYVLWFLDFFVHYYFNYFFIFWSVTLSEKLPYLPPLLLGLLEPTPCPKVSNSCPDNSLLSWHLSKISTRSTKMLCEVIVILIHAISSLFFFFQTDPSKLEVIWSTSHPYSFLFIDTPWPRVTENQACLRLFSHQ